MKITYFRLKGYVNILQGMGLDELIIPFDQFKNRIILIQGANGTGKSTILKALSPEPDSSDSFRTDVFINNGIQQIVEYPAEKEIHYIDNSGNTYKILIQSVVNDSKTSRSTKAYISKNGEEYNPNGTVSGFREIRDNLFGIDSIYLDMSAISSENRGLVDMIPSDRRKYLASYIGSLDTFNQIYKSISKKVSLYKNKLNDLNSKIYQIGDENSLRILLSKQEESLKQLNSRRDELLKELSNAETTISLLDPDNKIQDLFASISERLGLINTELEECDKEYVYLLTKLSLNDDIYEIGDIENKIKSDEDNLKKYENLYVEYNTKVNTLTSLNNEASGMLDKNRTMLNNISTNTIQDNIEEKIDTLNLAIKAYEEELDQDTINILKILPIEQISTFKEDLNNLASYIKEAYQYVYESDLPKVLDICLDPNKENQYNKDMNSYKNSIENDKIKSDILKRDIEDTKNIIEKLNKFDSMRPSNCVIDDCPFISDLIELKNKCDYNAKLNDLTSELEDVNDRLLENNEKYSLLESLYGDIINLKPMSDIINSNKSIISLIPKLNYLLDKEELKSRIINHYDFHDFNILDTIISQESLYKAYNETKDQVSSLEGDLKVYKNNKALIDSLTSTISELELEYSNRDRDIKKYIVECDSLKTIIEKMKDELDNLKSLSNVMKNKKELSDSKSKLKQEYATIKDNIKTIKSKIDIKNDILNNLESVDNNINPLRDDITKTKISLTNLTEYQETYKEYSSLYEKIVFIRDSCSPGNGQSIQSQYVKMYMNEIILTCNMLLGYMFNGTIKLEMPIIDQKQFSIPFIGPGGREVPDISKGSTAQKCMIGLAFSCASMIKSSNMYNIPRFDEIDGGLDQQNRTMFIAAINQVLDVLNADQCIMVSHNTEFDTQSTTLIYCSPNGITITE